MTETRHLAELNIGRLVASKDDPVVAEFMNNLDKINGLGKRMPGFVWMMEGSGAPGTGNTETSIAGDPRYIPNLTVWEDVPSLRKFVFDTVHSKFMARKAEWFEVLESLHFVMWWVEPGHQPSLEEALDKLAHLQTHGASDVAFDWAYLQGDIGSQQA